MIEGIDVSHYQGAIDYDAVAREGRVKFAFVKLGGGDWVRPYLDAQGERNVNGFNRVGIPVGGYWYFSSRNTVQSQIDLLTTVINRIGRPKFTLGHIGADIEDALSVNTNTVEVDAGLEFARAIFQATGGNLTGLKAILYTAAWFWNQDRVNRWRTSQEYQKGARSIELPLWAASYTALPIIPEGWGDYTVWQFSDKGRIAGIAGDVDMNRAKAPFWEADPPKETVNVAKVIVTATELNIRPGPLAAGTPFGTLKNGQEVETVSTEGGWHKLKTEVKSTFAAGGAGFTPTVELPAILPDNVYISAAWTKPKPEVPAAGDWPAYQVGGHVIGDHGMATTLITKGAPYVTMMHGALEGFQRAAMMKALGRSYDRVVIRPWFGGTPTVMDIVNWVGPRPDNPTVVVVGSNEGDRPGGLIERAKFDYALATELRMRQPNIEYACMSSAHGNEDYTNPEVCKIIETHYAPHYNSGLFRWVDQHNYTFQKSFQAHPPADAQMVEPKWFERRGLMLIERCGFRPDKVGIINTECGVEAGHGGMRWAGYTQAQFREWLNLYLARMREPFVFGGTTFPSPFAFGTLFMLGSDQTWSGGYGLDDLYVPGSRAPLAELTPAHLKYIPRLATGPLFGDRAVMVGGDNPRADDYSMFEMLPVLEEQWAGR